IIAPAVVAMVVAPIIAPAVVAMVVAPVIAPAVVAMIVAAVVAPVVVVAIAVSLAMLALAAVSIVIGLSHAARRVSLASHRDRACREGQEEGTNSEGSHGNLLRGIPCGGMNRRALLHRQAERFLNEGARRAP